MRIRGGVRRGVVPVSLAAALLLMLVAAPAHADEVLRVHPHSGPAGTVVHVEGSGLFDVSGECIYPYILSFKDATGTITSWSPIPIQDGAFQVDRTIPADLAGFANLTRIVEGA